MRTDGTAERPLTHRYLSQHEQWIVGRIGNAGGRTLAAFWRRLA